MDPPKRPPSREVDYPAESVTAASAPRPTDLHLRSCGATSIQEMDTPGGKLPPSGRKDGAPESHVVAAALPPPGETTPSVSPLTLSSADVWKLLCAKNAAAAAEPPSGPHLGEKRSISRTKDHPVASRMCLRRTLAPSIVPVEAPAASSTKPSQSAARNEAVPTGDRIPNISSATPSSIISAKPDRHGGCEPGATKSPGSARGATGEAAAAGGVGRLASYKRISILGEGGCGTVWKARDTRTCELVAIKSVKKERDGAALLREAALLASCRGNPAVVRFREVICGPGADDVHIVMDFPGRTLRDLLDTRRRFTESETRDAMRQLLADVEKIGTQGIIHGDLKPENILVNKSDGRLLMCDFGLAVSVSNPPCHIEGTVWYSSPEQLLRENCGPAVDAWALGCVMAELVTGRPLVEAQHPTVQWTQIIFFLGVPDHVSQMENGIDASTPSQLRDRVPEELLTPAAFDVLQGLLQYSPQDRLTPAAALQMPWFTSVSSGLQNAGSGSVVSSALQSAVSEQMGV